MPDRVRVSIVLLLSGAAVCRAEPASLGEGASSANKTEYRGTYRIAENDVEIRDLVVRGNIVVTGKNVTLSNLKLVSEAPWHALDIAEEATGFTLQDSEINGEGRSVNAIFGHGKFLRNHLYGVHNGINVTAPSVIRENRIDGFKGGADAHFDGIEINGGYDIEIVGNTIINKQSQTSAVMLNNYFTGLSNIRVEGNRLVGGGYTVYLDGRFKGGPVDDASISIVNNQIGGGIWGDFAFYDDKPVVKGNVPLDEPMPK